MNVQISASLSQSLYSADQVKSNELPVAEKLGKSGWDLMQQAGQAAFDVINKSFSHVFSLAVVCGNGNNGGDGYVVATLARQQGLQVALYADDEPSTVDAKKARQLWLDSGGDILPMNVFDPTRHQLIVDAILGTGLKGDVRTPTSDLIQRINCSETPVLSLDVPSGLCANTGSVLGSAIKAEITITFIVVKMGLVTGQARNNTGQLLLNGLGIQEAFVQQVKPAATTIKSLPLKKREAAAYKTQFGKILCIGGNKGMSGAIRLCSEAALRTGAGLVKVLTHEDSLLSVTHGRPELMVSAIQLNQQEELQQSINWADIIVIGPGLGQDEWATWLFEAVQASDKPKVIDADGLNLLAKSDTRGSEHILTPHPGEAARLLNCTIAEIEADRYHAATKIQQAFSGSVILKGAGSLVTNSRGETSVCLTGNPGMATAGMGDVLAGICGGLLGQLNSTDKAAIHATNLHALAGDMAAKDGMRGLLASDLFAELRKLIN